MDSSPPHTSRPPRAVLTLDPFVSNAQTPLQFLSTGGVRPPLYSNSRKGLRDVDMSPVRGTSHGNKSPSAPPPAMMAGSHAGQIKGPAIRSSQIPPTPTSPSETLSSQPSGRPYEVNLALPSLDVEMTDSFATPPMSRIFPTTSNLRLSASASILPTPPSQRNSLTSPPTHLAPINTSNLLFPIAPLTPPLTPPFSNASLPNPIRIASPAQHAPPPPSQPPTLSATILQGHTLHPLFQATYTIHEELGCGGFGFVVRASIDSTGESVAVKFIERSKIPADSWVLSRSFKPASGVEPSGPDGQRLLPLEAYVLGSIKQIAGVVKYIDLYEDPTYFYLIMELHGSPWLSDKDSVPAPPMYTTQQTVTPVSSPMFSPLDLSPPRPVPMARRSSCDLFECIEQHSRFSEATARHVFRQIVEVVYQLGKHGIYHRDIKDENIVVSADYEVKLIDFGSAVIYNAKSAPPLFQRFYGTTSFASPEILRGELYEAPPCEVWSLGILLSILITGEVPFSDPEAAKVGRLSTPRVGVPPELHDLMRRCLTVDVERRITIGEMRRHSWLRRDAR
ncbi:hypothetical protein RQP46_008766 [Phenoliferia psychrophenolica]